MFDKIIAHTSFIGETGYANHARNFFTALNKIIPVKVHNFAVGKTWKGLSQDPHGEEWYLTDEHRQMLYKQTLYNHKGELQDYYIYGGDESVEQGNNLNIVLVEVNHHYFYDDYKGPTIAYNVWESTLYPQDFFNRLLKFDQLWVPTEWQKTCAIKQGYPPEKIRVVPEAVDGNIFFPEDVELIDDYKDERFKFLLFGRWDYRKSTSEIIDTFLKTFGKTEPVDIIISVDNMFAADGIKTTEERLKRYCFEDDRIKVKHFPTTEEYVKYLKTGHVFLSCARSEGWNLPLIEAMACGTPSIYSNWGAQLEFANQKGIPVNIIGEELASKGAETSYKMIRDNIPGYYCEPDFKDLSLKMRDVYDNYQEHKSKAIEDSKNIIREFSWKGVSGLSYKYICSLYNDLFSDSADMEVYQDQYINGKIVKKGKRDCQSRYEVIKQIFEKYNRPFTILDIGANVGYYSIRASDEYGAVSVLIEQKDQECNRLLEIVKENRCSDKIIVLQTSLDIYALRELAKCEHFDVVLALNVLHHFPSDQIPEICELFVKLGDNLVVENPPSEDKNSCGQESLRLVNNYLEKKSKVELGKFRRHTSDTYSSIFWLKTDKKFTTSTYFGYDDLKTNGSVDKSLVHLLEKKPYHIISNYDNKKFCNPNNGEFRDWIQGINLCTFLSMGGIYPSKSYIAKNIYERNIITNYKWDNSDRDIAEHNFILEGQKIHMIDYQDGKVREEELDTDQKQIERISQNLIGNVPTSNIAILTGSDINYMPYSKLCVGQLSRYLDYPISFYLFNSNDKPDIICNNIIPFQAEQVKKISNLCDNTFHIAKIKACLHAIENIDADYYLWIDSDSYVTSNIKRILDFCGDIDNYPLCMIYRDWSLYQWREIDGVRKTVMYGDEIGQEYSIERGDLDFIVAAGIFIFNKKCKEFFKEVISIFYELRENTYNKIFVDDNAFSEERVFNLLFRKYRYKKHLPITWVSNGWFTDKKINLSKSMFSNEVIYDFAEKDYDLMFEYKNTKDRAEQSPTDENIMFFHSKPFQKKHVEAKMLIDRYNMAGKTDKVKLNLGCGEVLEAGYINIDLHSSKADIKMDVVNMGRFGDNSVDEIRASHLLEHFSKKEVSDALREWHRVLKIGGIIHIEVPDLEYILLKWLHSNNEERQYGFALDCIYGNQNNNGEFHKTGFTRDGLRKHLENNGFIDVNIGHIKSHGVMCYDAIGRKV